VTAVRASRVRGALSGTRALVRLAYRDPEHVAERLTLYAAESLGQPSQMWADAARSERGGVHRARLADELGKQSARVARIDGAIAGTPFLVALAPGYVAYLWQEARMSLRIAALYDHDPTTLHTAAEVLMLRGVHPTVEQAERALLEAQATRLPPSPPGRRPLRTWFDSVYRLLVFGGFLGPPSDEDETRSRLRRVLTAVVGTLIWVTTWVLPVTFMIAMSWACESHTRDLGRRAREFYAAGAGDDDVAPLEQRRNLTGAIRAAVLTLSVAIPIVFVAWVNHVRSEVGVNWLGAIGALVAVSLVAATSVIAARR
jgi:hypothetical protein